MYVNILAGTHHSHNEVKGIFKLKKAYNPKTGNLIISVPALNDTFPRTLNPRVRTSEGHFYYCDITGKEIDSTPI